MTRVLVITTEPLPVPGGLTTGAGLRAWGLAEGLRSRGFDVTIATPLEGEQAQAQSASSTDDRVIYCPRSELSSAIEKTHPDVIVMQHWGLMYAVPPVEIPIAIDLAGPHLLERLYWGNRDSARDLEEKLTALGRADFVISGGEFQKHYFYPYLAMAGFDLQNDSIPVIPFSVSPEPITGDPADGSEPTCIYGGAFLAWQNPEQPIRWLLDEMDKAGRGRLLFYGGAHPNLDASGGRFIDLYSFLGKHPRVEMRGWKPFTDLTAEYAREGHVALDLMVRNPERELAYTTRTMVYLACGLPVIYNDYSEISGLIRRNNCGWSLDPTDESGFRTIVRSILDDPDSLQPMRTRARAAALAQSWDKTIGPLADFCADPQFRTNKTQPVPHVNESHNQADSSPKPAQHTADQRFFHNKGKFAGNLVYFPTRLLSKYLQNYFKV